MRPTLLVVLLLALTVAAQDCHQGALIDTNAFLASVRGICVSIVPSHRGFRFTVLDAPFLGGVRVTNCTDAGSCECSSFTPCFFGDADCMSARICDSDDNSCVTFRECTSTPVNDTASIDLTCKEPLTEMDPLQLALLSADLKWYIINNQETCNLTACHFQLGGPRDIEVDDADTISFSVLDEDDHSQLEACFAQVPFESAECVFQPPTFFVLQQYFADASCNTSSAPIAIQLVQLSELQGGTPCTVIQGLDGQQSIVYESSDFEGNVPCGDNGTLQFALFDSPNCVEPAVIEGTIDFATANCTAADELGITSTCTPGCGSQEFAGQYIWLLEFEDDPLCEEEPTTAQLFQSGLCLQGSDDDEYGSIRLTLSGSCFDRDNTIVTVERFAPEDANCQGQFIDIVDYPLSDDCAEGRFSFVCGCQEDGNITPPPSVRTNETAFVQVSVFEEDPVCENVNPNTVSLLEIGRCWPLNVLLAESEDGAAAQYILVHGVVDDDGSTSTSTTEPPASPEADGSCVRGEVLSYSVFEDETCEGESVGTGVIDTEGVCTGLLNQTGLQGRCSSGCAGSQAGSWVYIQTFDLSDTRCTGDPVFVGLVRTGECFLQRGGDGNDTGSILLEFQHPEGGCFADDAVVLVNVYSDDSCQEVDETNSFQLAVNECNDDLFKITCACDPENGTLLDPPELQSDTGTFVEQMLFVESPECGTVNGEATLAPNFLQLYEIGGCTPLDVLPGFWIHVFPQDDNNGGNATNTTETCTRDGIILYEIFADDQCAGNIQMQGTFVLDGECQDNDGVGTQSRCTSGCAGGQGDTYLWVLGYDEGSTCEGPANRRALTKAGLCIARLNEEGSFIAEFADPQHGCFDDEAVVLLRFFSDANCQDELLEEAVNVTIETCNEDTGVLVECGCTESGELVPPPLVITTTGTFLEQLVYTDDESCEEEADLLQLYPIEECVPTDAGYGAAVLVFYGDSVNTCRRGEPLALTSYDTDTGCSARPDDAFVVYTDGRCQPMLNGNRVRTTCSGGCTTEQAGTYVWYLTYDALDVDCLGDAEARVLLRPGLCLTPTSNGSISLNVTGDGACFDNATSIEFTIQHFSDRACEVPADSRVFSGANQCVEGTSLACACEEDGRFAPVPPIFVEVTTTEPPTTTEALNTTTEEFNSTTAEFNATTAEFNATTAEFNATTAEVNATTTEFNATTAEFNATTAEFNATTEALNTTTEFLNSTTEALNTTTEAVNTTTEFLNSTTEALNTTTEVLNSTTQINVTTPVEPTGPFFLQKVYLNTTNCTGVQPTLIQLFELDECEPIDYLVGAAGNILSPNPETLTCQPDTAFQFVVHQVPAGEEEDDCDGPILAATTVQTDGETCQASGDFASATTQCVEGCAAPNGGSYVWLLNWLIGTTNCSGLPVTRFLMGNGHCFSSGNGTSFSSTVSEGGCLAANSTVLLQQYDDETCTTPASSLVLPINQCTINTVQIVCACEADGDLADPPAILQTS